MARRSRSVRRKHLNSIAQVSLSDLAILPTNHISRNWVNPLSDSRWAGFLRRHADSSIFHTPGWLEALQRTYGYRPLVLTTSAPAEQLTNGIVLCRMKSWITGTRIVSLPFSDHCQPLVDDSEALDTLMSSLKGDLESEKWKYIEVRPLVSSESVWEGQMSYTKTEQFCIHRLDLRADLEMIFRGFHKSCIQRKIQRANRERLVYEKGHSASILRKFYYLTLRTRRRHQLPPQPLIWFQNLISCLGDRLTIAVVSKDEQPIASILTLAHKSSVVYKYGGSDERLHNLGGMPYLFWKAIQNAKANGAETFDFGRSSLDNPGLIAFKDNWGGTRTKLTYYRSPAQTYEAGADRIAVRAAKKVFSFLPDRCLTTAGRLLYRHIG
jgi:lipid II:glycine glycyltransferase (peptidoglycan interpeptide bridge formation enzyme)